MSNADLDSRNNSRDSRRQPRYRPEQKQDTDRRSFINDSKYDDTNLRSLTREDRPTTRLRTLDSLDQRTRAAKLARHLIESITSDLGGERYLSTAQKLLVQRAAILSAIVEDAKAKWLNNEKVDLGLLGALGERLRRMLGDLGLERRLRDVTPGNDATMEIVQAIRSRK